MVLVANPCVVRHTTAHMSPHSLPLTHSSSGSAGLRSRYLSHAKGALYQLSYRPFHMSQIPAPFFPPSHLSNPHQLPYIPLKTKNPPSQIYFKPQFICPSTSPHLHQILKYTFKPTFHRFYRITYISNMEFGASRGVDDVQDNYLKTSGNV